MGRRFAPLGLDEVERAELTSLASRRSTARALALRAGSSWPVLKASRARWWQPAWLLIRTLLASGVGASPSVGLKVFGTSGDRGRRAPSRMPGSRR